MYYKDSWQYGTYGFPFTNDLITCIVSYSNYSKWFLNLGLKFDDCDEFHNVRY